MIWGVVLGLTAATAQSVSYIFSRVFVIGRRRGVAQLLVLSHIAMGVVSAALLPVLWTDAVPALSAYLPALAATSGFYLLGQLGLFLVLRHVDASRVSPLLGMKILMLAVITVSALGGHLSGLQWTAVALGVAAAFILHYSGGAISLPAFAGIVFTCLCYSLSDLSIQWLLRALEGVGAVRAPVLATCLSYVLCGLAATALLPWARPGTRRDWPDSLPFAAFWFLGMILFFAAVAAVGVVFANILQSTRGLISILIGAHVAGAGMIHVERRLSRGVFVRRMAAASLMCLAIALFVIGRS
jgi:drug/metabolite transporter (DMT)-like permease